jgi:hypothetical protein
MNIMKQQDNREVNNQQVLVKDLTVNKDQAAAIKGGPKVKLNTNNCGG